MWDSQFPGYPRFLGVAPVAQRCYRCDTPRRNPLGFRWETLANQAKWRESSTKGVPLTAEIRISAGAQFRAKNPRAAGARNRRFRTKGVGVTDVTPPTRTRVRVGGVTSVTPTPLVRKRRFRAPAARGFFARNCAPAEIRISAVRGTPLVEDSLHFA